MYKIYNNLAPSYLHEMLQMREVNLDSTLSNLRSVANKHYVLPQAKFKDLGQSPIHSAQSLKARISDSV